MELKFLGRGSAHNYKEGNTSAYFIENNELFLIDCGESIFAKLREKDLLDDKKEIHILITHTHSDHIGSIGSLITYCYYSLKKNVNIIISPNIKQKEEIETVLKCFGVKKDAYNLVSTSSYENKYQTFSSINYLKTEHSSMLNCFSIIFETPNGQVFYSGDSNELGLLQVLLKDPTKIDKMYLDTCNDKSITVHMYIEDLDKIIPKDIRNKVYAMHVNNDECIKEALNLGFKVVEIA